MELMHVDKVSDSYTSPSSLVLSSIPVSFSFSSLLVLSLPLSSSDEKAAANAGSGEI